MPNHVHGTIVIRPAHGPRGGVQLNAPTPADARVSFSLMSPHGNPLAVIIRTYKAAVTTLCRRGGHSEFAWQRNYYERIVRDEDELDRVRQYIADNPLRWALDSENPAAKP